MNNSLVRINSIGLEGFKNTLSGLVYMPSAIRKNWFSEESDILGIYGQNGSGKTAIIDAMLFVQKLLMGFPLPNDAVHYISKATDNSFITVNFAIDEMGRRAKVEYLVELRRNGEGELEISRESLAAAEWNGEKFERKKVLFSFSSSEESTVFAPQNRYRNIVMDKEDNRVNLTVAKKLAQKGNMSYIFNEETWKLLIIGTPEHVRGDYEYILRALKRYASINLFVIGCDHSARISMNMPIYLAFRLDGDRIVTKGDFEIPLDKPAVMDGDEYDLVRRIISGMNGVLETVVPGLTIDIHDFGEQLLGDGEVGHRIELISRRGDICIPLRCESEGILKIVSILNVLICVYNDPSMCLIIDELDAGIYEYLLGELLATFDKGAKGQIIFTSHNLRALEMLNKSSIVFSTTNSHKRYIPLKNVKTNNNLRDVYLRSIILGGQEEEIYAETDTVEIGRAFRRAGEAVCDGE